MKKFLKIVGVILLLIIVFALVAGLFVNKNYHFEKSTVINAPKEKVWENVRTLANVNKWNPWMMQDPGTKVTYEGQDGTVGAIYRWESEKVGSGNQTFTKLDPPNRTESHIHFIKPFAGEADSYIQLDSEGTGTKVTWGFTTELNYLARIMHVFMNMDKMMGESFDSGFAQLKKISEAN